MPLKILSSKERRAYTVIPADIDEPALRRYFVLGLADIALAKRVRGAHNRLGLVLQLGWLRWLGHQPDVDELPQNPSEIGRFLAAQLNLSADDLRAYGRNPNTWNHHQMLAREHLSWLDCGEDERARLGVHLRMRTRR